MNYMDQKAERNAALLRALHGIREEPPAGPEGFPNFDGGARETAPLEGNPEQEHNQTVLDYLQQLRGW